MTTMAFVYLARNAGPTFDDLAWDMRSLARPGDHVVVVDDGSTDDTPTRIGRFGAFEGWGTDVAVTTIITGTAVTADLGLALNLALSTLAVPGHRPDRVAVMTAGSRIDAGVFAAARAQAEAGDLDLVIFPLRQWSLKDEGVIDPPGHADWPARQGETPLAHALRQLPAVGRMIIGWPVLQGPPALRATEDRDSHSDLALVWQALTRARRIGLTTDPAGHGPQPPAPGWASVLAAADLIGGDPAATDWVMGHMPGLFAGLTTESAALIATHLSTGNRPLPPLLATRLQQILQNRTD
jgi:hypothetical protein